MNASRETIIRTIVLFVALLNQVLTMFGLNPLPFSNEDIYGGLTALFTVAATIWSWWKNNSFTQNAIEADEFLKKLKKGE